jgi:hypothetical protein
MGLFLEVLSSKWITVRVERSGAKLREVETPFSEIFDPSTSALRAYAQDERDFRCTPINDDAFS